MEEIKEFDFKKINKNYNKLLSEQNNLNLNGIEKINLLLQKNNSAERYNPSEYNYDYYDTDKNGGICDVEGEAEVEDNFDLEGENENFEKNEKKFIDNDKEKIKNIFWPSEEKDNKIINEIINIDDLNQDEAVNYIKKLINNEKCGINNT